MASPQRALPVFSPRHAAPLLIGLFVAIFVAALLPGVAHADPHADAARAQAQLEALANKTEVLTEKYNAAQVKLDAARRALSANQAAISKAEREVAATKAVVAQVATSIYEAGGMNTLQQVLESGDPQIALQRASVLAFFADQRADKLRSATAARTKLTQARATAAQQTKSIEALQASLMAQRKTIDAMVGKQQSLLKTAQQEIAVQQAQAAEAARQAQVARQAAARAAAAEAARQAAAAARASRDRAGQSVVAAPVSASGRAEAAVRYAYAQLGKPYRWGGAGPNSFDCSGLTMRAWQAAGVNLPHNAAMQYAATRHVPRSQLQPGDLVFFGNPIHHDGIYIGGGKMIEAPYTGANVRITDFGYRTDFAGASRP